MIAVDSLQRRLLERRANRCGHVASDDSQIVAGLGDPVAFSKARDEPPLSITEKNQMRIVLLRTRNLHLDDTVDLILEQSDTQHSGEMTRPIIDSFLHADLYAPLVLR